MCVSVCVSVSVSVSVCLCVCVCVCVCVGTLRKIKTGSKRKLGDGGSAAQTDSVMTASQLAAQLECVHAHRQHKAADVA